MSRSDRAKGQDTTVRQSEKPENKILALYGKLYVFEPKDDGSPGFKTTPLPALQNADWITRSDPEQFE